MPGGGPRAGWSAAGRSHTKNVVQVAADETAALSVIVSKKSPRLSAPPGRQAL